MLGWGGVIRGVTNLKIYGTKKRISIRQSRLAKFFGPSTI